MRERLEDGSKTETKQDSNYSYMTTVTMVDKQHQELLYLMSIIIVLITQSHQVLVYIQVYLSDNNYYIIH